MAAVTYERKLKHHFDNYLRQLALSKQKFNVDNIGITAEEDRRLRNFQLDEVSLQEIEDKVHQLKAITYNEQPDMQQSSLQ